MTTATKDRGNRRVVTAGPGNQTVSFTREFEAPADLVFRAHVDPDILARWTGPAGTTMRMREFDARSGGCWSYLIEGSDGAWGFHGCFHEITPSRRLVQTWEFEDDPEKPTLEVLRFVDLDGGRSRLEGQSIFLSVADRDAMLGGMDSGMDENFDRLEALLAG